MVTQTWKVYPDQRSRLSAHISVNLQCVTIIKQVEINCCNLLSTLFDILWFCWAVCHLRIFALVSTSCPQSGCGVFSSYSLQPPNTHTHTHTGFLFDIAGCSVFLLNEEFVSVALLIYNVLGYMFSREWSLHSRCSCVCLSFMTSQQLNLVWQAFWGKNE